MAGVNKTHLTETDIITKFILPAVKDAGWDDLSQIRQDVKLRDGKAIVRGKLAARLSVKSADIVLYDKPGLPLAVIEAKTNKHEVGKGMQQSLDYVRLLDVPFVFASNGDGFVFHDKTNPAQLEPEITLNDFPTPGQLWNKYCVCKGFTTEKLPVISQDYHNDSAGNQQQISNIVLPLRPVCEQGKIIEITNNLLVLISILKTHLQSAQQTQLHLADALTDATLN